MPVIKYKVQGESNNVEKENVGISRGKDESPHNKPVSYDLL